MIAVALSLSLVAAVSTAMGHSHEAGLEESNVHSQPHHEHAEVDCTLLHIFQSTGATVDSKLNLRAWSQFSTNIDQPQQADLKACRGSKSTRAPPSIYRA